jgi:hypothetical protein
MLRVPPAHAEIVVRTPDSHVLRPVLRVADRFREAAGAAFEIGKNAVATFLMQAVERVLEKAFEIHS